MVDGTILIEPRLPLLRHGQRIRWRCVVRPSCSLLSPTPRALLLLFFATVLHDGFLQASSQASLNPATSRGLSVHRRYSIARGPSKDHSDVGVECDRRGPIRAPLFRRQCRGGWSRRGGRPKCRGAAPGDGC
jgi:hypothetical protein